MSPLQPSPAFPLPVSRFTFYVSRFTFYLCLVLLLAACYVGPQPDARQPIIPEEVRSECPVWGRGGSVHARQIAYAPDGKTLAVAGQGISLRDTATGRGLWCIDELDPQFIIGGLKFSPDGQTLGLYVAISNTLQLRRVDDGTLIREITDPTDYLYDFDFSPDGRSLATTAADGTVRWYSLAGDAKLLWTAATSEYAPVATAVSPDGRTLAVRYFDGQLDFHNTADGSLQRTVKLDLMGSTGKLIYTRDGSILIAWTENKIQALRLSDNQNLLAVELTHDSKSSTIINNVMLSPNGNQLAVLAMGWLWLEPAESSSLSDTKSSVNDQYAISLWNTSDWSQEKTLNGGKWIYTFAYAPDGQQIVTSWNNEIAFWNLKSEK